MGYDGKYGRVTTERKDIPDDEPVIVLRAQDMHAIAALSVYWQACADGGADDEHLKAITETHRRFSLWQQQNPGKVKGPDTQPGEYS
jgi:hypothetical protein